MTSFTVHRTWDGQFRLEENGCLSAPMTWERLGREIGAVAAQHEDKGWSRPLAHKPKRALPAQAPTSQLYEIHKGKVRKVRAGQRKDRLATILAALDLSMGDLEL